MSASSNGFQVRTKPRESAAPDTSTDTEHSSQQPRTQRADRVRTESEKISAVSDALRGRKPREQREEEDSEDRATGSTTEPRTSRSLLDALDPEGAEKVEGGASERAAPSDSNLDDVTDIKSLAAKLGTSPKKLYESIKFQIGESQLTLGQLKDQFTDQHTAVQETVKREAALSTRESALIRDQQVLAQVMGDLQGKLRPETVKAIQDKQRQQEAHEFEMMRRTMPELTSDPKVFSDWREDVAEMLSEYGYKPHEINIQDHRMLLVIRDMLKFKKLLAKVADLETSRTRKDPPGTVKSRKQSRPNGKADRQQAMQSARRGSEADKIAAISGLIRGN